MSFGETEAGWGCVRSGCRKCRLCLNKFWARTSRGGSMADARIQVFRGDRQGGQTVEYKVPVAPGMVVLDALHYIQGHLAPDLAVRGNCKAGKCGSCSAEATGRPRLTCKTRMDDLPQDKPI